MSRVDERPRKAQPSSLAVLSAGALLLILSLSFLIMSRLAREGDVTAESPKPGESTSAARTTFDSAPQSESHRVQGSVPAALKVLTVDWEGRPLGHVTVEWRRSAITLADHVTDVEGTTELVLESGDEVVAKKEGFVDVSRFVYRLDETVTITMIRPSAIAGFVVDVHGNPVTLPVTLFLWEDTPGADGIELASAALRHEDSPVITRSGAGGRFLFSGVAPSIAYRIAAGGAGFLLSGSPVVARGGDQSVTLPMLYGFGARVRVTDDLGSVIDLESFSAGAVNYEYRSATRGEAEPASCASVSAVLAGFGCHTLERKDFNWQMLFTARERLDHLTVSFYVHVPGFESSSLDVLATPLSLDWMDSEIRLVRSSEGLGQLLVAFESSSAAPPSRSVQGRPAGLLHLHDSTNQVLSLSIAGSDEPEALLNGIPFGAYRWSFSSEHSPYRYPSRDELMSRVEIGPQPVRVAVQLPATGALTATIVLKDGRNYDGPAIISLGLGHPRRVTERDQADDPRLRLGATMVEYASSRRFETGPYRIERMLAGDYCVCLQYPFSACGPGDEWTVTVPPDGEHLVEFVQK